MQMKLFTAADSMADRQPPDPRLTPDPARTSHSWNSR
jgi:hypothetical protein